jgi:hypothetical protein
MAYLQNKEQHVMSDQMVKAIAAVALLLHGLGHGGALGALVWIRLVPGTDTGQWLAARTWLIPSLSGEAATAMAGAFWILSLVGFVVAAMSLWGVFIRGRVWRPLAVVAALVSATGIVLFFGTWPMFNTLAALSVNAAVLVAVLWLRWSPDAALGA